MRSEKPAAARDDVISLAVLWSIFWSRRLLVAGTVLFGSISGVVYSFASGATYEISTTIIPAESDSENSSMLSQIPAFLLGGSDRPVSKFKQFQAALYSEGVATLMDREHGTLCVIFGRRCNPLTHQWEPTPAWKMAIRHAVSAALGMPPPPDRPDASDLARFIKDNVTVAADQSSVVTLTLNYERDDVGREFLRQLVDTTNEYLKNKDRQSLQEYVAYLSSRLKHLENVEQHQALDTLLLTEERRLMLTEVGVAYAAATLDEPRSRQTSPLPKIAIGALAGLLLGCALTALLHVTGWRLNLERPLSFKKALLKHEQLNDA